MGKVAVIVPAAGKSTRFGGPQKKPFVSLDGRPIWLRAAELFWGRADVSRVYLVVAPDDADEFRGRFAHLLAFNNVEIVPGGAERFESVANALARISADVELVAVHDAVRPLTPPALVDEVFAAATSHGAAMPAVAVVDTLKRVDPESGIITGTFPRQNLWQAQTPQVFRRDWLDGAYARRAALADTITDDAQLLEAAGHPVRVVPGSPVNFKITTKADLELAEAVLGAKAAKANDAARPVAGPFDDEAGW